jgi:hypothetical protein
VKVFTPNRRTGDRVCTLKQYNLAIGYRGAKMQLGIGCFRSNAYSAGKINDHPVSIAIGPELKTIWITEVVINDSTASIIAIPAKYQP